MNVWAAWRDGWLVGAGALKRLSATEGEVKSMHTGAAARRAGVGRRMLEHIVAAAQSAGMARLSLETGSWPYFEPARSTHRRGSPNAGRSGSMSPIPTASS